MREESEKQIPKHQVCRRYALQYHKEKKNTYFLEYYRSETLELIVHGHVRKQGGKN